MPLINPALTWEDNFVDNQNGTCWGQCLMWLSLRKSGQTRNALDFTDLLGSISKANSSQCGISYPDVKRECTSSSRQKYHDDTKFIDEISWTGKHKIVVIEDGIGNMHAVALYSPWMGAYELFDPNQGVYKSKNWIDIKSALLGFVGYDPINQRNWFFQCVLTVPDALLKA